MQPVSMPRRDHPSPAGVQIGQHRQVVRAGLAREGGQIVIRIHPRQAQAELGKQRALIIQLALHTQPGTLPILGDPRVHHPGRPACLGQTPKTPQQFGSQLQSWQSKMAHKPKCVTRI